MLHTHSPIQGLYDQQQHINLTAIRSLWKTFFMYMYKYIHCACYIEVCVVAVGCDVVVVSGACDVVELTSAPVCGA